MSGGYRRQEQYQSRDDMLVLEPLMAEPPRTRVEAERLRQRIEAIPLIHGVFMAEDATAALIVMEMANSAGDVTPKREAVARLRALMAQAERPGLTLHLAGSPPLDVAFFDYSERDFSTLAPLVLVVLLILFIFRRWSAVLAAVAIIGLACVWTFGLMGLLGYRINVISAALIPVILAVGIADSIHIIADYYQRLALGQGREEALAEVIRELFLPCFFTSATTAIGFCALMVSDLAPVRQFGMLAAFGVTVAFLLSICLCPALLACFAPPTQAFLQRQSSGLMQRLLVVLGRPSPRLRTMIISASAVLLLVSAWGITRLHVGANPLDYFREGDPVRLEHEAIDRAGPGTMSVEALVTAPDEGFKDPEVLRRVARFQEWLGTLPGVGRVFSVVDELKELDRLLNGEEGAEGRIPDSRELAAQYYLLLESDPDFGAMLLDDYETGRVTALVKSGGSGELAERAEEIDAMLSREYRDDTLRIEMTGYIKLMSDMDRYLLSSQRKSFLLALVLISAMLMLLLRSIKLGLFSLIPNVTPIVVGLGFMAFNDIDLDPGTVMIGAIALGLVVDDTVHLLVRIRRRLLAGDTLDAAIEHSMHDTGRALIATSLILAGAFSVLAAGSFRPNIHFGLISALIIILALAADLLLLPAMLLLLRPRFRAARPRAHP